jgi:putative ABC transport system permease protein
VIVLVALLAAAVVVSGHDAIRRPTLRRLALRNANRRKGEAVLVLVGSLLATAIITASFVVGDTLGASIRDYARTQLGPVDEAVRVDPGRQAAATRALTASPPMAGVDGVLPLLRTPATVTGGRAGTPRAEPKAFLVETSFDQARAFGRAPATTGLAGAGATPSGDEVVLNHDLAHTLHVAAGDPVDAYAYGHVLHLRVRQVVPELGVAGLEGPFNVAPNAFVAPGTIQRLAATATANRPVPPQAYVLVSNTGGVFDGARGSARVEGEIRRRLPTADVEAVKKDLLDQADANAKSFTTLFSGIGAFSVIAGVLLLVNIFVMLADERKSELGMLRAVGLKRSSLVRAFGMEGGLYAVAAAAIGAVTGIGVGRVIMLATQSIFNQDRDNRLTLRFVAPAHSVVLGFLIGTVIGLVTVWAASIRIGRLNVIRAIRDLPEPVATHVRRRTLVLASAGVLVGGLLAVGGIAGQAWFGALAGIPVAAFSAVPLLTRLAPRRAVVTACCAVALVWAALCISLLPSVFHSADIPAFVVQGVILVAAAVSILSANAELSASLFRRVSGGSARSLAARLGLAYPLARKFRTSMLLGMYALVIFTMTFLSVFSRLFAQQLPQFTADTRTGYDIVLDTNPANPPSAQQVAAQPGVAAVAPLLRALPRYSDALHPKLRSWTTSAFDERFLAGGGPRLGRRIARFASDRAVWEAVRTDPGLVVVSNFFLQDTGGPPKGRLEPGAPVTIVNPTTGQRRTLRVAGNIRSDFLDNGAFVGAGFARSFFGAEAAPSRFYVAVRPGADAGRVADRLTTTLVANGADALPIAATIRRALRQNEGFFTLMRGYLALGLLVGIAGLGVVMVRAVRERRRQIGMLRAMGFPSRVVRRAFLFEAVFVAAQGIVIGTVLALFVSWSVLTNSKTFGDQSMGFQIPWASIGVVLVATLAASLLAILLPATQASRIKPAVALRIAD